MNKMSVLFSETVVCVPNHLLMATTYFVFVAWTCMSVSILVMAGVCSIDYTSSVAVLLYVYRTSSDCSVTIK